MPSTDWRESKPRSPEITTTFSRATGDVTCTRSLEKRTLQIGLRKADCGSTIVLERVIASHPLTTTSLPARSVTWPRFAPSSWGPMPREHVAKAHPVMSFESLSNPQVLFVDPHPKQRVLLGSTRFRSEPQSLIRATTLPIWGSLEFRLLDSHQSKSHLGQQRPLRFGPRHSRIALGRKVRRQSQDSFSPECSSGKWSQKKQSNPT